MNWKLFLFIVFAFIFAGIMVIIQTTAHIGFEIIVLPQLAPTLAYVLVSLLFKDMYRPIIFSLNKSVFKKALIALLLPLALFVITYLIGLLLKTETTFPNKLFQAIIISIVGIIIGCIAEEIGWRSFFQPALEKKHSVFIASLIVGIIWGLWHVSSYRNGLLFMLVFIVFTISVSVIIVFLQKDTQSNVIISSVFHSSINIGAKIFSTDDALNTINSVVWLILAILITVCGKKYMLKKR